jgi:hypothetical protein
MPKPAKDRPAAAKTNAAKPAAAKSAASRPTPARKSARAAPDTRAPERETSGNSQAPLSAEEVYRLIQESAYFKAKARGFAPGHEVQDWIEAEQEVRRRLEGRA